MHKRYRITIRDIAVLGMMLAMLEAVKRALEFLPNVELVTLLFILFTLFYGAKTLLAAFAFTGVECLVFGAGLWNFMYLYIWPLEVLLVLLIRRKAGWEEGYIVYCVFSGAFGLFFGLLCSIVYIFTSGPSGALGWWISGIPFDILHGAGNFTLSLILFKPFSAALRQIQRKFS